MSLRSLSIGSRLMLAGCLSLIIVLFLVIAGVYGYRMLEREAVIAASSAEQFINLQLSLRGLDEVILTQGTPTAKDSARKSVQNFNDVWTKLIASSAGTPLQTALESQIAPKWQNFSRSVDAFLNIKSPGPDNDEAMVAFGRLINVGNDLTQDITQLRSRSAAEAEARIERLVAVVTATGALLLVALLALFIVTYSRIMAPVRQLQTAIVLIDREHDLTRRVEWPHQDDLGQVTGAFNSLISGLQQIVCRVLESMARLRVAATDMVIVAERVREGSERQQTSSREAVAVVETLHSTIADLNRQAEEAGRLAETSTAAAAECSVVVTQAGQAIQVTSDSVGALAAQLEGLKERSSEVDAIVKVIREIANQTNLLALNAAIESARAGELGRGFAVVADEVRKLADKTDAATTQIAEILAAIRHEIQQSVGGISDCQRRTSEISGLSSHVGKAMAQVQITGGQVSQVVAGIVKAANSQQQAARAIVHHVEAIAESAQGNLEQVRATSDAAEDLQRMATDLKTTVADFKT
ncbi:MAG: methyl-accepting chemotaxis protein [Candidatus Accumulibacter sp.]|nr:methyl-accepting chemotaxis protein [Accumulibacter sp.]